MEHELSEEERKCPECGEEMEVIGKKVTKHLEIIPAQVRIREDVYFAKSVTRMKQIHRSSKRLSRILSSKEALLLLRRLRI